MVRPLLVIPVVLIGTSASLGQSDPSGIDFVTIGNPGNAPWTGGGSTNNRGEVDYTYRIGRFEVTTAQWCEFMNSALDRPANDRIPDVFAPTQWGGVPTTPVNGGQRFRVPTGNDMLPTGGVDWRTCAIYCNWLCNGKSNNRSAFLSGAYDVTTFGFYNNGSTFTDQLTRTPGAQYFIPSLDEMMKASHWDPNRHGSGQGGWWLYSNGSDTPYVYGPAGVLVNGQLATANAAWGSANFPGHDPFSISLGAYTGVTSPWGLFDVAGGTSEWLEEAHRIPDEQYPRDRYLDGSGWDTVAGNADRVNAFGGGQWPTYFGYEVGFRIAAAVPAPAGSLALGGALLFLARRRRL